MWSLLLTPLLLYLALLLLAFAFQTRLIFPAGSVGGAGPLPPGAERLSFDTAGGERLSGVHFRARNRSPAPRTLILGFAGNAWNAEAAAAYLHDIYPEHDVVAFHYRGYRPSTGTPSAAALVEDAVSVHDQAVANVRPERTIAVGFSIGSGVAASLAGRRPVAGLILVTPFDSLKQVARGHYPWLPVGLLFRHEMRPAHWLSGTPVATALIAAERDPIIPPRRTEALRRAAANVVFDRTVPGAGHNDIYDRPEFRAAMREALSRLPGAA